MIGFTNISSLGGETVPRRWVSAARRVSILFPPRYPAFALHVAALAACSLIAGMPASRAEAVGPMRRIMAFPGPCRDPAIDNAKSHKLFFYSRRPPTLRFRTTAPMSVRRSPSTSAG